MTLKICASLVKISPLVKKITRGNEATRTQTPMQTPTPTGSAPKTICPPPLRLGGHNTIIITPASNLTYLAPHDNYSWVPNCSWGASKCETNLSKKIIGLTYVKMHGFHGNLQCDSQEWGYTYKINNVLAAFYLRQQNSVPEFKPRHRPFIPWSDIQIISFAY